MRHPQGEGGLLLLCERGQWIGDHKDGKIEADKTERILIKANISLFF